MRKVFSDGGTWPKEKRGNKELVDPFLSFGQSKLLKRLGRDTINLLRMV